MNDEDLSKRHRFANLFKNLVGMQGGAHVICFDKYESIEGIDFK
jgi:hypothetical protein